MTWKLNSRGEFEFNEMDPEKIEEVSCPDLVVYGVKVRSRWGQVSGIIRSLDMLHSLSFIVPQTVQMIEEILFVSDEGTVVIDLRESIINRHGVGAKAIAEDLARRCVKMLNVRVCVRGPGIDIEDMPDDPDDDEYETPPECRVIELRPK
jgi:hypothetical protein